MPSPVSVTEKTPSDLLAPGERDFAPSGCNAPRLTPGCQCAADFLQIAFQSGIAVQFQSNPVRSRLSDSASDFKASASSWTLIGASLSVCSSLSSRDSVSSRPADVACAGWWSSIRSNSGAIPRAVVGIGQRFRQIRPPRSAACQIRARHTMKSRRSHRRLEIGDVPSTSSFCDAPNGTSCSDRYFAI